MINKGLYRHYHGEQRGFTLLEVMVVVMIISVLAAIAIPSYQEYVRRAEASKVTQEMLKLSQDLERYKARNFNYVGFDKAANTAYSVPSTTYTITIIDGNITNHNGAEVTKGLTDSSATGKKWAMRANANDNYSRKYNFLLTSDHLRCKNKTFTNVSYTNCGSGAGEW